MTPMFYKSPRLPTVWWGAAKFFGRTLKDQVNLALASLVGWHLLITHRAHPPALFNSLRHQPGPASAKEFLLPGMPSFQEVTPDLFRFNSGTSSIATFCLHCTIFRHLFLKKNLIERRIFSKKDWQRTTRGVYNRRGRVGATSVLTGNKRLITKEQSRQCLKLPRGSIKAE